MVIITKSKLTILNQLLKYMQRGCEEWENMLLVQYSWSIAAFAKQVCLLLLIFHLQKSPQLSSTCVSKRNACLVLGPPLSPLSSWSSCWRGWSNLCLTPLTPFTLKRKRLFRFHEETYHFGLFMIGLRLESLNGIKPCISTNACMGKESHFILIKQYHFIQKKSATVQQATAILDWNPTFYLQFSRNPQLFYILKQGSHGDFAVFFNCLCSVVSS